MKFIRTHIEVAGSGRFPFDMLRYDTCVPTQSAPLTHDGERTLLLTRFSPEGTPATADRWMSFGWVVTADTANGDLI